MAYVVYIKGDYAKLLKLYKMLSINLQINEVYIQ